MRKINHLVTVLLLLFCSTIVQAQDNSEKTVDTMRSNGRIYVVIVVILVILTVLFLYLVRLDRKIRKMEKG